MGRYTLFYNNIGIIDYITENIDNYNDISAGRLKMDKSWIREDRYLLQYEIGVENFLIFAEGNAKNPKKIPCPCGRCVNFKKLSVKAIRGHLYEHGVSLGYVKWIWHA